jgi:DNA-binding NarL/FixJ family response regulator
MGEAFSERARRELMAGDGAHRTVEMLGDLTAQEAHIRRLAREGLSDAEICAGCWNNAVRRSTVGASALAVSRLP